MRLYPSSTHRIKKENQNKNDFKFMYENKETQMYSFAFIIIEVDHAEGG